MVERNIYVTRSSRERDCSSRPHREHHPSISWKGGHRFQLVSLSTFYRNLPPPFTFAFAFTYCCDHDDRYCSGGGHNLYWILDDCHSKTLISIAVTLSVRVRVVAAVASSYRALSPQ